VEQAVGECTAHGLPDVPVSPPSSPRGGLFYVRTPPFRPRHVLPDDADHASGSGSREAGSSFGHGFGSIFHPVAAVIRS
jgi:hypothetical protein